MSNSNECIICCDKINKINYNIKCEYCVFEACKKCCQTYILDKDVPTCMSINCNKEWNTKFLMKNFTKTFIKNELKQHKEKVLFDKERALLPATMVDVERIGKIKKIEKELQEVELQLSMLTTVKKELINNVTLLRMEHNGIPIRNNGIGEKKEVKSVFTKKCPDTECRGFLSTQWKCGICEKWACPECHEIKGLDRNVEHTCNPDNLATAKLLEKDTKECPKCNTQIYKIDGCDQMWCTQCHTAFSWRTGTIEKTIHNPHYYEWMRKSGKEIPRAIGDNINNCVGNVINQYNAVAYFRNGLFVVRVIKTSNNPTGMMERSELDKIFNDISIKIRNIQHIRHVDIKDNNYFTTSRFERNRDLRISYLMNEISEEKFKITLQRDEKKFLKEKEINDIRTLLIDTSSDILNRFYLYLAANANNRNVTKWDTTILNEFDEIIQYVNECLVDVSNSYSSKLIQYDNNLNRIDKSNNKKSNDDNDSEN